MKKESDGEEKVVEKRPSSAPGGQEAEQENEEQSLPRMVRHSVVEWLENSSVHGVPKIMKKSQHKAFRLFWLLCFAASAGYCGYSVLQAFFIYLQYQVMININTVNELPAEFPTITICNVNMFNTEIGYSLLNKATLFARTAGYSGVVGVYAKRTIIKEQMQAGQFAAVRNQIGLNVSEMVIACVYNGQVCKWTDFEYFFDVNYGTCFSFNSGHDFYGNKTDIRTVSYPGYQYGLQLELFVGYQSMNNYLDFGSGIYMLIHNHTTYPIVTDEGIYIPSAALSQVSVSRQFFTKLSEPYSSCLEDTETFDSDFYRLTMQFSIDYRQKLCMKVCYQQMVIDSCGCYDAQTVRISDQVGTCGNASQFACANSIKQLCNSLSYLQENCLPHCPQECDSINYGLTTSGLKYPTPYYADYLLQTSQIKNYLPVNATYSDVANSVLLLDVFYDSLSYTAVYESPYLTFFTLLSNFGGFMGLCLGISILSLLEVFELAVIIIIHSIYKFVEQRKSRRIDPAPFK